MGFRTDNTQYCIEWLINNGKLSTSINGEFIDWIQKIGGQDTITFSEWYAMITQISDAFDIKYQKDGMGNPINSIPLKYNGLIDTYVGLSKNNGNDILSDGEKWKLNNEQVNLLNSDYEGNKDKFGFPTNNIGYFIEKSVYRFMDVNNESHIDSSLNEALVTLTKLDIITQYPIWWEELNTGNPVPFTNRVEPLIKKVAAYLGKDDSSYKSAVMGLQELGIITDTVLWLNGSPSLNKNGEKYWSVDSHFKYLVINCAQMCLETNENSNLNYSIEDKINAFTTAKANYAINSPNIWIDFVNSDEEFIQWDNRIQYLIPALAKGIHLDERVGCDLNNYEDCLKRLSQVGVIDTPEYWTESNGKYKREYVILLFEKAFEKLNSWYLYRTSRKNTDVNFLYTEGLINSKEYWETNAVTGKSTNVANTKELIRNMAITLGCQTDQYNDMVSYLTGKGIIGDPGYWYEASMNDKDRNGSGCDGQYVSTIISRFIDVYKKHTNWDFTHNVANDESVIPYIDVKEIHKHLGIYVPTYQAEKNFKYYNRWRRTEYEDAVTGGQGYVFFTKPKLNLSSYNVSLDQFYTNMSATIMGRTILENLTYDTNDLDPIPRSPRGIQKLLTNKALNFDASDIALRQDITVQTVRGYKYSIPGLEVDSMTNGSFSINYSEDQSMAVTLLHKAWVDYIVNIKQGIFSPSDDARIKRYIDYVCSVYYFLTAEDGVTIRYFCKYTGVYPMNIPYSGLSFSAGDNSIRNLSVNYAYSVKDDMNPDIIREFNTLFNDPGSKVIADKSNQTWMQNVCIMRLYKGSDGRHSAYMIDETENKRMYFDGTAKLIFYDDTVNRVGGTQVWV